MWGGQGRLLCSMTSAIVTVNMVPVSKSFKMNTVLIKHCHCNYANILNLIIIEPKEGAMWCQKLYCVHLRTVWLYVEHSATLECHDCCSKRHINMETGAE